MKPKNLLLMTAMTVFVNAAIAQDDKESPIGFAITSAEKGGRSWREVKLLNFHSGETMRSVFNSNTQLQPLNARTKKPVMIEKQDEPVSQVRSAVAVKKIVNLDAELEQADRNVRVVRAVRVVKEDNSLPFATNSAAMAYDKKHDRLYYTPMGINQLRYIDLKSGKLYYFENEAFGLVKNFNDVKKQITRMVIAADGNGYALSNDAQHLLKFTTGKKPVISDLGAVADKTEPLSPSLKIGSQMGGDMIADAEGNLYLISAHRNVYKISIDARSAKYLGAIKGLPKGYSTNGAMVEEGSKVIVCSSESTHGYYRFDLISLEAEKITGEGSVFNASDLANGNLAFDKKKKDKKPEAENTNNQASDVAKANKNAIQSNELNTGVAVFPNPVTDGVVKVSFENQPSGRYQVHLMDMSGKIVHNRSVSINGKNQLEEFRIPEVAKGSYFVKVMNESGKSVATHKLVVQ